MHRRLFAILLVMASVLPGGGVRAAAQEPDQAQAPAPDRAPYRALWQRMRSGGVIILLRHAATVPGIGDPVGFKLGNCASQRNLSDAGRRDARAIGTAFRGQRVVPGAVWSSRWCRCLETARLAFGRVQPEPALDSLFNVDDALANSRLRELHARLAAREETTPLVLVTHDVNIRALTGEALAPGDMLLTSLRDGKLVPFGRLPLSSLPLAAHAPVAQSPQPSSR